MGFLDPDSNVSNLLLALLTELFIYNMTHLLTFITQDIFWMRFPFCFKQVRNTSQFQVFSAKLCPLECLLSR